MMDRTRCASIILVVLGIGFVIGGTLLFVFGGQMIASAVKKDCVLKQGTVAYKAWLDPAMPLHISFYVFDLNDTEFLKGTKPPTVQQRGPFVYKEVRTKEDVVQCENGTISYHETRSYKFDRDLSSDDDSVKITTMSIVYMALVNYLQAANIDHNVKTVVAGLLNNKQKPTMQRTVHEILWGYADPLLGNVSRAIPMYIANNNVSIFYASIREAELNTFLINNGAEVQSSETDRIKQVGNIEGFNGERSVSYWTNKYANMINGTDGTIWHPDTTVNDQVYMFSSDLCRSLQLKYSETHDNTFGIETHRFVLPETAFANTPENEGFCLNSTIPNKTHELCCLSSGLMSLKSCVKLSNNSLSIPLPIIASNPHFLDAADSVKNALQGLQPDETLHRSFMDVQPITGTVMNRARRMQVNLNVVNDSSISAISQLKSFVYPIMWFDEQAEINKTSADEFRSLLVTRTTVLNVMKYLLLAIGAVLFIIVIALIVRRHERTKSSGEVFPLSSVDETTPMLHGVPY